MSEVGALIVRLQAETAQFRSDLGKVKGDLDDLKDKSGEAGSGMSAGMGEARGSLMLVEESLGVRIPRHLNSLIATIPGVGETFALMLPLAGVAAALAVITKLIEAHDKLKLAEQKSADETENLSIKLGDQTKNLELTGLKLDDQIAKLEGRPSKNHLAESLLETSIAADKLASEFAEDFQKINESVIEAEGTMTRFWQTLQEKGSSNPWVALHENMEKAFGKGGLTDTLAGVTAAFEKVEAARIKMQDAAPGSDAEKNAQAELIAAYGAYETAAKTAYSSVKGDTQEEHELQAKLTQAILESSSAQKDFAIQAANAAKEHKIAGLEDKHEDNPAIAAAIEDAHKLAQEQYSIATESAKQAYDQKKITLEQEVAAEKDAIAQKLAAEIAFDEAKKKLAGTTAAQIKSLSADEALATLKASQESAAIDDAYWKEVVDKAKAATEEIVRAKMKAAEEDLSIAQQTLAQQDALTKASTAQSKGAIQNAEELGLISKRQALQAELAFIKEEETAKLAALAAELAAKQRAMQAEISADEQAAASVLANNGGDTTDPAYLKYLDDKANKQRELNALQEKYNTDLEVTKTETQTQLSSTQTALSKLNSSWAQYFQQMKTSTLDLSTQIRVNLQQSLTQFTQQFAQSMAQCILYNKNLGKAVEQEAGHMLESMLSMLIQWLEKWIITHTLARVFGTATDTAGKASAASLAGANMVASWSAAPWPLDAAAPAMGAQAFAAAMAFETGGKIPGDGAVPIIGHGGETVVTKALTDRVERAEGRSGSGETHMHIHNNINASAIDAQGMDKVLEKHSSSLERAVRSQIRRMNKR